MTRENVLYKSSTTLGRDWVEQTEEDIERSLLHGCTPNYTPTLHITSPKFFLLSILTKTLTLPNNFVNSDSSKWGLTRSGYA